MDSLPISAEVGASFNERYALVKLIGQGGFGRVYKARRRATEQEVAIKILRPPWGGARRERQKQLARFQRELRICSRLFHPNIVRPLESGQTEKGLLYCVFDFIPGLNLAQTLAREGRLTPGEATHLMLQVLDALDCAHRLGVVHRDIKPQNIMITDTGARRNALVLDFGLSTFADEFRPEDESVITSTLEMIGTPAYAAPEQLKGMHAEMRSDLYSWGLVYLECLTGHRVMQGQTVREVLKAQLGPDPVPIPEELEGLRLGECLRQATEKDIHKRDLTASELLHELESCEQDEGGILERRFALEREGKAATPRKHFAGDSLAAEGQLRQLTVLCCDMTVSPSRTQAVLGAADLEEQDGTWRAQQRHCIQLAEEHGGYLGGVLGRQMMFYFGYTTAREDACRCAARTAMELLEHVSRWNAAQERQQGSRVELRMGIHTGIALVRRPGKGERQDLPSVLGTTPAVATEYQEMAALGEVLVSPEASRLLRKEFAFDVVPRFAPRAARQLEVARLRQERSGEPSQADPPMVGRVQELELLLQRWTSVRQGNGQTILITGDPGIGKSRLMRELLRQLGTGSHLTLECRCSAEERASALRPIIGMLEHLLGRERDGSCERCWEALEQLLSRYGFELEEAMPLFSELLSIPPGERYPPPQVAPEWKKALTFNAVLNLLMELATEKPVLLLIEDLHWADPTTLEFLTFMLDAVPTSRLGVFFTARPGFIPRWPAPQVLHLQLGRLERALVDDMIAGLTRGKALPEEISAQVAAQTDGVPLFVEAMTRMVLESGVVVEEADRYRLARPLSGLSIPCPLRGLLEARLDQLGRAKQTAELAAILGREFSYEMLRALSSRDEKALRVDLQALVEAGLLLQRHKLNAPTYLFKHALIRDAAYGLLPSRIRREMHARIATLLEERFRDFAAARPEVLAYHWAAAEQKSKALRYAHQAATEALQRSASTEALMRAQEAVGWLDTLEDAQERRETELKLNNIIAQALMASQGFSFPKLGEILQRSRTLFDQLSEGTQPFPNLRAWMVFCFGQGELGTTAQKLARRLLDLALEMNDRGRQVAARAALGMCHFSFGHLDEARVELKEALRLYDPQAHRDHTLLYGLDSRIWALSYLVGTLTLQGQPEQALAASREAEAWAQELNNPRAMGSVLLSLCCMYHLQRRRELIPPLSEQMRQWVNPDGFSLFVPLIEITRAWATGDLEKVEQLFAELAGRGGADMLGQWKSMRAELLAARGRRTEALEVILDAIAHHRDGSTYFLAELIRLKGTLVMADDASAAEACLREAVSIACQQGARLFVVRANRSLARLLLAQGRREEALRLLHPVQEGVEEGAHTS